MEIKTITVEWYSTGSLNECPQPVRHRKILPFLSIVQALEGAYEISIEGGKRFSTGEGGVFIAPAGKMQDIIHNPNKQNGNMKAHWIFLDVKINNLYSIDDLYSFPVIIPPKYSKEINCFLTYIRSHVNMCKNLSVIYKLIGILLEIAVPKQSTSDPLINKIQIYIEENYHKKISAQQLAQHFNISVSGMFRKFQKNLKTTPANYINDIRLSHASALLLTTNKKIYEVAEEIGIPDQFYFSKLFCICKWNSNKTR